MGPVCYRRLEMEEAERISEIDASQFIGRAYRQVDGFRQLVDINYMDTDFPYGYEHHLAALIETMKQGGVAWGAFHDRRLIGFCCVNADVFGIADMCCWIRSS